MRACETVGALEEEEEKVLDPSLTPLVTLDATFPMSPLWVSFPSGKQQDSICTVGLGQRGTDEGKVASGRQRLEVLQAGPGLCRRRPHLGRGCCWSGCAD